MLCTSNVVPDPDPQNLINPDPDPFQIGSIKSPNFQNVLIFKGQKRYELSKEVAVSKHQRLLIFRFRLEKYNFLQKKNLLVKLCPFILSVILYLWIWIRIRNLESGSGSTSLLCTVPTTQIDGKFTVWTLHCTVFVFDNLKKEREKIPLLCKQFLNCCRLKLMQRKQSLLTQKILKDLTMARTNQFSSIRL